MDHFPIFLATAGRRIVLSGGGDAALAKLRPLMKTTAHLTVFAAQPDPQIEQWAKDGKLRLIRRTMEPGDTLCAVLFYAADENAVEDARTAAIAHADGALVNVVDNLQDSQFITPAIVDRDPVTVAIGTEGAAPVLARAIKADLEERLPTGLGTLARIGKAFRKAAEALTPGRPRRDFWREYYFNAGPRALAEGQAQVEPGLFKLLNTHLARAGRTGHVAFVGAGPGDPELLTLKARRALDEADVVIHDRLVSSGILELARTHRMYAIAEVYETDIARVAKGQRALITSPALAEPLTGVVEWVSLKVAKQDALGTDPAARKDARVVEVEVRLDDSAAAAALTNLQVEVLIEPSDGSS